MIRHFIGVILLFLAAVLTPLAEFLKCFIGADIIDVVVTYSGHNLEHSFWLKQIPITNFTQMAPAETSGRDWQRDFWVERVCSRQISRQAVASLASYSQNPAQNATFASTFGLIPEIVA